MKRIERAGKQDLRLSVPTSCCRRSGIATNVRSPSSNSVQACGARCSRLMYASATAGSSSERSINTARFAHRVENQLRRNLLLFGASPLRLSPIRTNSDRRLGRLPRDVNAMRPALRARCRQAGRRPDAAQRMRGRRRENWRARSNAAIAIARAVRSLQYWSTAPPSQLSQRSRRIRHDRLDHLADAPGTSSSDAIAPLPPPVIDSSMCLPEA